MASQGNLSKVYQHLKTHKWKYCLLLFVWISAMTPLHYMLQYMYDGPYNQINENRESGDHFDLHHLRKSRDLKSYLDSIELLSEPSSPCQKSEIPVVVLVATRPLNKDHRQVIRDTWGKELLVYFVLGVEKGDRNDNLKKDNLKEAKEHSDMIIYSMVEHYQNLTLKTMLMLNWTQSRCPQAEFFLKTDDDVLINPWVLEAVIKDHQDDQLIGFKKKNTELYRQTNDWWFVPHWLFSTDYVTEYLLGVGYLIKGIYIQKIYNKAIEIPLVNMEDVYVTNLVAKEGLGLKLTHDYRMSAFKPKIVSFVCEYWMNATYHDFSAKQMYKAWGFIKEVKQSENLKFICNYYKKLRLNLNLVWMLYFNYFMYCVLLFVIVFIFVRVFIMSDPHIRSEV